MANALVGHEELVAGAVQAHGGTLIKSRGEGDSTLSVFRLASDAVTAAIALQRRLSRADWPDGLDLPTRIAVHTGEAHLRGGDYYGGTLNRAARIRALAAGGQVLCSRATADLVADTLPAGVDLREVGTHDLPGLRRAETVYALVDSDDGPTHEHPGQVYSPAESRLPLPTRLGLEGVFVGRDREQAWLDAAFDAARHQRSCHIALVAGEPGIGKTTLSARFARAAHTAGALVLYGHCDEGLGMPYQPWAEGLAHLVRHAPETVLRAHVAARGGELARLVPDLAARTGASVSAPSDPEADRHRLFGAVVDLLVRVSSTPIVFVIEDLHWADLPTLQLLRHVAAVDAPLRMLLVATYRDTDVSDDHPLAVALGELHREPTTQRITLDGLAPDALGALLEAGAGQELDADGLALRNALMAETDGNPFFVTEVLRDLVESGAISRGDDGRWSSRGTSVHLPLTLREVITQRVSRLGEETRRLLEFAAVVGRDFELDLLADVAMRDEEPVLDSLDAATAAALVRPAAGGTDRYTFVHALIAHALLDAFSPARRRRVHASVARALESRYGTEPGAHVGELARHSLEAGDDPSKAIDYASRAGEHALAQLAPDDGLRWYRQALDVLDRTADPDDPRRGAVLFGLGDAQRQTGDPGHRATLLAAAEIARQQRDTDLQVRAVVANSRGMIGAIGGVDDDRLAALESAQMATAGTATRERALVLATLAAELAFDDRARMHEVAREATELARHLGDDRTLVTVVSRLEAAIRSPDTLAERVRLADDSIAAAERVGDPVLRWHAAAMSYTPALESGDLEQFERRVDILDRLASDIGQPFMRWVSAFARSLREQLHGRLDQAEELATEALEIGTNNGQPDVFMTYAGQLMAIRLQQGRLDEVLGVLEQSAAANPGVAGIRAALALAYCETGRESDARPLLEAHSADGFSSFPSDLTWASSMDVCARVAAMLGDQGAAVRLVELLEPWRDQVVTTGASTSGALAHSLGLVLAVSDRPEDAEDAFAQAAATNEHIGAPVPLANTHVEWAYLLRHRDPSRARELAHAAHTTARDLGARWIERRAGALLESLGTGADASLT